MKSKTVDINVAQTQLKDLVHQVTAGTQVILSEDDKPVAQLVPVGKRIAGLHRDTIWISEDFNAPLPEEFWAEGT